MNLSEALARARNYTGMTQTELAVRSGTTQQLIAKIERGQQKTTSYVPALARACGLSTEAFLSGSYGGSERQARTQVTRPFKRVTYHPDIPEADEQGCPPASQAAVTMIELHREVLRQHGVKAADAALLQASGDAMEEAVGDGDLLLIDRADTRPREGRIYAVRVTDTVLIRRVQWLPDGLRLIADNPAYAAIDADDAVVIGRVVVAWHASRMAG